jgi:RNA polymerase sigma-70 factor (ECF subfamily)
MSVEPALRDALLGAIPGLRAFAFSLTSNSDWADDLVQTTILQAWANIDRFKVGTNLKAWLFTILRNAFRSEYRRRKREVEDVDGFHAGKLTAYPEQQAHLDFEDFRAALGLIPVDQREAILLVGAQGMSYDEAAAVCGVAVGTVKSRVNRARRKLARLLGLEDPAEIGPDSVTKAALAAE